MLSDYQFQLKKIEEDFAGFKVNVKIQKDKMQKKYSTQITTLKKKIQQDNSHWHQKFIETENRYKQQKQAFQHKTNYTAQQKINKNKQSLKHEYEAKLHKLEQKVKCLKHQIEQKQKKMTQYQSHSIKSFNSQKQVQLKELCIKNEQKQSQLIQQMNHKIQSIKFQKSIQQKKYTQTAIKHKQQLQKYKTQINNLIRQKDSLKADIKQKQKHIINLQLTIKGKEHRLIQIKKQMDWEIQTLNKQEQQNLLSIGQSHSKQIKQLKSDHLNQLDKYYQRLNKLQSQKHTIEQQFHDKLQFLQQKFNQRVSKIQDTEQIRNLRSQIISKNRQISRYQQDLRKSELQRQNNEKNYSRIFSSHSSRRKSASNTPRDKDAFFKHTNTTDLKMFLKICNKEF